MKRGATPPFGMPVRIFLGFIAILIALYLGHGLIEGDIRYGECKGRMSRNCNTSHFDKPVELVVGTLHLGTLVFALGCLAIHPLFFLRKTVMTTSIILFVLTTVLVFIIMQA